MKTLLFGIALAAVTSAANAQVYVPQSVANGAVLGGIAGAVIGGHNNDRWGQGGLIGAAVGALLGAAVDQGRQDVYNQPSAGAWPAPVEQARVVPAAPVVEAAPVYAPPAPTYYPEQTYPQAAPQVVYVDRPSAPQVVYVERPVAPRVVYVAPPPVYYYPRVVHVESPRYSPPPRYRGRR